MSSKVVIVLGGFSTSGKTTWLKYLKQLGYGCYSVSEVVHKYTEKTLNALDIPTPTDREEKREIIISLVEKSLIPIFGRNVVVGKAMDNLLASKDDINVIETIGGEEWELIEKILVENNRIIIKINLRNDEERPGIDIRKLLPDALTIYTNSDHHVTASQWDNLCDLIHIFLDHQLNKKKQPELLLEETDENI